MKSSTNTNCEVVTDDKPKVRRKLSVVQRALVILKYYQKRMEGSLDSDLEVDRLHAKTILDKTKILIKELEGL